MEILPSLEAVAAGRAIHGKSTARETWSWRPFSSSPLSWVTALSASDSNSFPRRQSPWTSAEIVPHQIATDDGTGLLEEILQTDFGSFERLRVPHKVSLTLALSFWAKNRASRFPAQSGGF